MQKSKAETFIGFSIRARKITLGFNSAQSLKRAYLLIVCSTATENAFKEALKLKNKLHCPLMICQNLKLEDIVNKENCKLAAIEDKQLASAILDNADENFKTYLGGNSIDG